jgi:RimJ/RimL family protein N-acetyltransferase
LHNPADHELFYNGDLMYSGGVFMLEMNMSSEIKVRLRDVLDSDLPIFFEQERDPDATFMAAFTPNDPNDHAAFMAHWTKIRNDDSVINQTILADEKVAGYVAHFPLFGDPAVAYWIGKEYWGKGITTQALTLFLEQVKTRPLYARAVKDNIGSIRVLQKCGFIISGEDKGFANARSAEVEEYILVLPASE